MQKDLRGRSSKAEEKIGLHYSRISQVSAERIWNEKGYTRKIFLKDFSGIEN